MKRLEYFKIVSIPVFRYRLRHLWDFCYGAPISRRVFYKKALVLLICAFLLGWCSHVLLGVYQNYLLLQAVINFKGI